MVWCFGFLVLEDKKNIFLSSPFLYHNLTDEKCMSKYHRSSKPWGSVGLHVSAYFSLMILHSSPKCIPLSPFQNFLLLGNKWMKNMRKKWSEVAVGDMKNRKRRRRRDEIPESPFPHIFIFQVMHVSFMSTYFICMHYSLIHRWEEEEDTNKKI